MKNLTVYVRNSSVNPSSYYRICQYIEDLKFNITLRESVSKKIYTFSINGDSKFLKFLSKIVMYLQCLIRTSIYLIIDLFKKTDTIIIQRELFPKRAPLYLVPLLEMISKNSKIIWDFDDDIFINGEISQRETKILTEISSNVIVTNKYLKSKFDAQYQNKIILMPTTDGSIYKVLKNATFSQRFDTYDNTIILLWIGTSNNLNYLKNIIHNIDKAAERVYALTNKSLSLRIVSGKNFNYTSNYLKIVNVSWSREEVINSINISHLGLMPLPHTSFSEGKGAFKLIQYMSGSLPVIASNIGFNKEVVDDKVGILVDDKKNTEIWEKAIADLCMLDKKKYMIMCQNSLNKWENQFSYKDNLNRLTKLIEKGSFYDI